VNAKCKRVRRNESGGGDGVAWNLGIQVIK
jgi:hypothetical protein